MMAKTMKANTKQIDAKSNQQKAQRIRFTKESIEQLVQPDSGRTIFYDTKTAGLLLTVSATGKKVFQFYRKLKNSPKRLQIGSFPEWTVDQARRQAAEYNGEIARGIAPGEVLRKAKEEQAKVIVQKMTFAQLFNRYYDDHSVPRKRTGREDLLKYNRHIKSGRWGVHIADRAISEITRGDISRIHVAFGKEHPVSANRLLALLSSIFSKGIEWDLIDGGNPCAGISKFHEESRARFLQPDELPRIFEALSMDENETVRDFVYLCLFTGARRNNVMMMKWDEINFDRCEWFIGMTKNGTPQTVPLVEEALALLKLRHEKAAVGEQYVLPASGKRGHLVEPKFVWKRILSRATAMGLIQKISESRKWTPEATVAFKNEQLVEPDTCMQKLVAMAKQDKIQLKPLEMRDLHVHDLRRTMGSWQANTGASLPIIGRSLNHKSAQSTQIYSRLMIDPVRRSMQKATSAMLSQILPSL